MPRSRSSNWLGHLARTVVLVLVLAFVFLALVAGAIVLRLNPILLVSGLVVLVIGVVYGTARWHPWWAPLAKSIRKIRWENSQGLSMETVVEVAQVQAGSAVQEVWRLSIYESVSRRRVHRQLVGDRVDYLGVHGPGIWFFLSSRFYSGRDGLICLDSTNGKLLYHWPKRIVQRVEENDETPGLVELLWNGAAVHFDLSRAERTASRH